MIYIPITGSCIYVEPEDLLSWVAHRPAPSERLIGQWPSQPTRGPGGHPLMLTQRGCVSVYDAWILWATSGTFASNWAQRGCSAHALCQHLHEVNQRGPEVIVTTFPCQSGRYFDKTTVNALLREAELHITSGELQHPLRHHQFIRRCKFALRRPHYY